jgi:hypothetical protein
MIFLGHGAGRPAEPQQSLSRLLLFTIILGITHITLISNNNNTTLRLLHKRQIMILIATDPKTYDTPYLIIIIIRRVLVFNFFIKLISRKR